MFKTPRHTITKATLADAEAVGIPAHVFKRRWLTLATLCGSLFSVMIANTGLNLALPAIATDLQLGSLGLTWIVEIYSLLFAALLFTFAAVGDRYGRKAIMQAGLVVFVASSLYAGLLASSGTELIVSRAFMGIGGAMVMPATLSIINVVFPPQERARAVAIWTGIAGAAMMFGVVIGGVLLDHLGWESTFFFSAGVAVVTLVCNQILVSESRDEKRTPVDWLGGVLSMAGLLGLVYGIMEAPSRGLDDRWVLTGLLVACICLGAFVLWQLKTTNPMLDVRLFGRRAFGVSALVVTLTFFALAGVFFGVSQLFMLVMEYGAFKTSVSIIPMMLPMLVLSPFVPLLAAKIGIRWTVACGLCIVVVGFVLAAQWPTVPSLGQIYLAMSILTAGLALAMTPATSLMMSEVPRYRSGMGSAMNDTTRELGSALGIAVLGALLSSGYAGKIASILGFLPEQVRPLVEKSLAGALAVAGQAGEAGRELAYAAKTAWMDSFKLSMVVAAAICAASAIIAALWMPQRERWTAPEPVPVGTVATAPEAPARSHEEVPAVAD